jgi:hypothetical protein
MISEALAAIKEFKGATERCCLVDKEKNIVQLDSVDNESWSLSTTVTNYPVEKGEDISDHIKVNADSITITATITNHTGINSIDPVSLQRIQGFSEVEDVVHQRLYQLKTWQKEGSLLTYFGSVQDPVENLVITSLQPGKDSGTGDAVDLSIGLQKVTIARYKEVEKGMPSSTKKTTRKGLAKTKTETIDSGTINTSAWGK